MRPQHRCLLIAVLAGAQAAAAQPAPNSISREVVMARSGPVFAAPSTDAPAISRLRAGATVELVAVTAERRWFQIRLPDKRTIAYLPAERLLPYDLDQGAVAPAGPGSPAALEGPPEVLDTATVKVAGRIVALDGIEGAAGGHASALQRYIGAHGGVVTCRPARPARFTCALPGGLDIAMAALVNGSALAAPDAPDAFQRQQAAAVVAHRGLFSSAAGTGPLPAGNAPLPSRPDRLAQADAGPWTMFRAASDADGSRACGLGTAWRGASASMTMLYVGRNAERLFTVALRDAGWEVPPGLSGTGSLVVDGKALPVRWGGLAPGDVTVLAGSSTDVAVVLSAMAKGHGLYAVTPLGRTGLLALAGIGPALRGFEACLTWAGGAGSAPAER